MDKEEHLNKEAIKSGSGYMLANILIRSTAIITAPIFTRILTTSDYGIASNFVAWLHVFSIFTGLGLAYSIGVAKIDFPSELNKFLASIQSLGSITAVSLLIIAIFLLRNLQLEEQTIALAPFSIAFLIYFSPLNFSPFIAKKRSPFFKWYFR